jgi:G protein beta subunit-like protein
LASTSSDKTAAVFSLHGPSPAVAPSPSAAINESLPDTDGLGPGIGHGNDASRRSSTSMSSRYTFARHATFGGSHQRWVWDAVFSADSAYLLTACSDGQARLWDVTRPSQPMRHYTGHSRAVTAVALADTA